MLSFLTCRKRIEALEKRVRELEEQVTGYERLIKYLELVDKKQKK
jgi:BMFP domain-containing protein YqiC